MSSCYSIGRSGGFDRRNLVSTRSARFGPVWRRKCSIRQRLNGGGGGGPRSRQRPFDWCYSKPRHPSPKFAKKGSSARRFTGRGLQDILRCDKDVRSRALDPRIAASQSRDKRLNIGRLPGPRARLFSKTPFGRLIEQCIVLAPEYWSRSVPATEYVPRGRKARAMTRGTSGVEGAKNDLRREMFWQIHDDIEICAASFLRAGMFWAVTCGLCARRQAKRNMSGRTGAPLGRGTDCHPVGKSVHIEGVARTISN